MLNIDITVICSFVLSRWEPLRLEQLGSNARHFQYIEFLSQLISDSNPRGYGSQDQTYKYRYSYEHCHLEEDTTRIHIFVIYRFTPFAESGVDCC